MLNMSVNIPGVMGSYMCTSENDGDLSLSLSFRGVGPQVAAEQPVSCKFVRLGKRRS